MSQTRYESKKEEEEGGIPNVCYNELDEHLSEHGRKWRVWVEIWDSDRSADSLIGIYRNRKVRPQSWML